MKIVIIGAAGFIGTNLALYLAKNEKNRIRLVDKRLDYFDSVLKKSNIELVESTLSMDDNFDYLENQEILYHLASSTTPTTSNQYIPSEIQDNVVFSALLFDACVSNGIQKVVFLSSGGTVYGKEGMLPLKEETPLRPITSYGMQKIAIENLLYLYNHMYGLDYRVIRLSNPYGPYQRPNGLLGAVTTFVYKALRNEPIEVYGDGSVIRDFIYIDDAIEGIVAITEGTDKIKVFNLGCGIGTSILEVLEVVKNEVGNIKVEFKKGRSVDVPINYLDISRFEETYGKRLYIGLDDGIRRTAKFLCKHYDI